MRIPLNEKELFRFLDIAFSVMVSVLCLSNVQRTISLTITARQYGEVVLPDASTGHDPDTLARKLSRCKEGMARVFAVMVQVLLRAGAIAVRV